MFHAILLPCLLCVLKYLIADTSELCRPLSRPSSEIEASEGLGGNVSQISADDQGIEFTFVGNGQILGTTDKSCKIQKLHFFPKIIVFWRSIPTGANILWQ